MTTASQPQTDQRPSEGGQPDRVSCPRCQTASPSGTLECPTCGRHFFVYCGACGKLNPRAAVRCDACSHELRVRHRGGRFRGLRGLVWPRRGGWGGQPRWVRPAQITAVLLAVFLGAQAIRFFHARFALPSGPGTDEASQLYVMPDGKIVELPPDSAFGKQTTD